MKLRTSRPRVEKSATPNPETLLGAKMAKFRVDLRYGYRVPSRAHHVDQPPEIAGFRRVGV